MLIHLTTNRLLLNTSHGLKIEIGHGPSQPQFFVYIDEIVRK
jgi:hypothetical protein